MTTLSQLPTVDPQSVKDGTALWSSQGYIDGLQLVWGSATSLSVASGRAYIPSLGRTLELPATYTLSGLALTASTWYHAYLYLDGATPKFELVTTAPSAVYYGTARTKTGDTSRRYIGSVLTDSGGSIWPFIISNGLVMYQGYINQNPFTALIAGTATSETTVSLVGALPSVARIAFLRHTNSATTGINTRMNNGTAVYPEYALNFASGADAFINFPVKSDQSVTYWYNTTPSSGGCSIQVLGYFQER